VKNILLIISLVAIVLFAVGVAAAQTTKAAYVDSEKILSELPEAQKASKELETLVNAWQDSLAKMNADLQKQFEDYQK
jgi:Skp family chaperone for outer membrane proteins